MYFVLLPVILFIISCGGNTPKYLELGTDSFNDKNYPLAKNQFLMVKQTDSGYNIAQEYISKIDSIENALFEKSQINDSIVKIETKRLMQKYSGNYKVEVFDTSSKEEVEIYILDDDGKAQWLWVYYDNEKKGKVDDRKIGNWYIKDGNLTIHIRGQSGVISETYVETNGVLINTLIKKRRLERTTETY
tara:strand:- start:10294 stop:10860 length:567 start_codon:yes stop_codon:yes gene_type:complete